MNIFLIGYRGTGKTRLAQALAQRLGWSYADADDEIQRRAGKSIARIFQDDGESAFRDLEVEVVRHVLGNIDEVSNGGESEMVNVFEDWTYGAADRRPPWWSWFSWPYWWYHFNSVGRITWNIMLEPGQPVELNYTWYYYWR